MCRLRSEKGAALVTVLVLMVIMLILAATMLSVTGNEILVAGLQRNSAQAFEHAQAGIEEAVRRIEGGRVFASPFPASLASAINVQVLIRSSGPSAAILEIQSDAAVGRARRRLSMLVLGVPRMGPPNIFYGYDITGRANNATPRQGDVYSQTYIKYSDWPTNNNVPPEPYTLSYAGWRISRGCNDPDDSNCPGANENRTGPCYNYQDCVQDANADQQPNSADPCTGSDPDLMDGRCRAFPGTRRAVFLNSGLGATLESIRANPPAACNPALIPGNVPLSAGAVRAESATQTADATPYLIYGFDRDGAVVNPNGSTRPVPPQAVITDAWDPDGPDGPLPVWSFPCGIPYKYEQDPLARREDGSALTVYFKTIVYEHWYHIYWKLEGLESVKRDGDSCTAGTTACLPSGIEPDLVQYPDFGAVGPFPDFGALRSSAQQTVTSNRGGEVLNTGDPAINWGNCANPTTCTGSGNDAQIILLQCRQGSNPPPSYPCSFTVNMNDDSMHGLLLVDGDLTLNGRGTYYGTLIVNGNITFASGNFTVYGGMVARNASRLQDAAFDVYAGGSVTNVIVGPAVVTRMSWWER